MAGALVNKKYFYVDSVYTIGYRMSVPRAGRDRTDSGFRSSGCSLT